MFTRSHTIAHDGERWVSEAPARWINLEKDVNTWINEHQKQVLDVIYPTLSELIQHSRAQQNAKLDAKHLVVPPLEVGQSVMVVDHYRGSKAEPHYVGPYKVVEVLEHGSYILKDKLNQPIRRSIQSIKPLPPVNQGGGGNMEFEEKKEDNFYEVEKIEDSEIRNGKEFFLVKWKGYEERTWEPIENFEDHTVIQRYHKEKVTKYVKRKTTSKGNKAPTRQNPQRQSKRNKH
jgi:hypothetical protein